MPLFRTPMLSQDPRYRYVVTLCNYVFATLFLGMVVILSGVMLMTYVDMKKKQDEYDEEKLRYSKILGIMLLIFGCLFMLSSFIVLVIASIKYFRIRDSPPPEGAIQQPSGGGEASGPQAGHVTTFSSNPPNA